SLRLEIQSLQSMLDALGASPSRSTFEEIVSRANKTAGVKFSTSRVPPAKKGEKARKVLGRRFISSDGYEIIVGRTDIENDQITFRVAGSQDVWLHAADYPGSHVVIRNPTRKPIPHRTIVEAAEVTAFHSQAKREGKVAVNYTQKKFVSKPPKSKPGLVRISSFKTVLVEPRCDLKRTLE
ncbi:MAG: NFACT RNA binding domain-containing protein, partial [Blastocatellia bacterium]